MTFSKSILRNISTTSNSKPGFPNIQIKNPLSKKTFVNQFQIFPSTNFGEKAILQIFVNRIKVFDNSDSVGFFNKFKLFDLPLVERQIDNSSDIQIFAWNAINGTLIEATISILISEINNPQVVGSIPNQPTELELSTEITDEGTRTTADGGSGIVATIYTCPANTIATVKLVETRARNTGSASKLRLLIRGQRISTWKNFTNNPYSFNSREHRAVYPDGTYPDANLKFDDLQGEVLFSGETIAYDGNFSSNFNATIDYAYTVVERNV